MAQKLIVLALVVLFVFGIVVAILLRTIPEPHRDTDYLVIGAVATLVALLALFVMLISSWLKAPDVFFRRRK
jgi:hypothetical protein